MNIELKEMAIQIERFFKQRKFQSENLEFIRSKLKEVRESAITESAEDVASRFRYLLLTQFNVSLDQVKKWSDDFIKCTKDEFKS